MPTTDQSPARRPFLALVALVAAWALAGCGSSGGPAGGTPPAGSGSIATHHTPVVRLDAGDNGRTITVSVGQPIKLRLMSTYWQIARGAPGDVLGTDGRRTQPSGPTRCVPGQGCGVASAAFTALHPGRAAITAARQSCGEALRCSPAQSHYRVQVVVKQ